MKIDIRKGDFSRMGVTKGKTGVNFCLECRKESCCKIILYNREDISITEEISVAEKFSKGNLRAVCIEGLDLSKYDYNYWIDGRILPDPYARRIAGRESWADLNRVPNLKDSIRCRYEEGKFSWNGDCEVEIPRSDMVIYKLHVRGFTKGLAEESKAQGTFLALKKKLSYLKSLGITTIELMPVYEFEEWMVTEQEELPEYVRWNEKSHDKIKKTEKKKAYKLNYWGYGEGMYFAPKASYAAGAAADLELKECILSMHKKGMECILEIDFAESVSAEKILSVLKFWVKEYHVDGFHLQGNKIPMELLIADPYLGRTKLFYRSVQDSEVLDEEKRYPRVFVDSDEFFYPIRKLLTGNGGNIWELADQMKKQNEKLGYVNYIADNNGFTLADLFAYEYKHNEANGEQNMDGPEWNFSTNCGVEGDTTSRNVRKIRERRMKNAIAVLFFAQGIPMLMAGDEDCNSQHGNNNAYCQDNEIGWKDWKQNKTSKEFARFVKAVIAFRKGHKVLSMDQPMKLLDTLGCGYPDLSYHEENAWISPEFYNRRALGILYCGDYAEETEDVYLGFNFSDFPKNLALPKKREQKSWYLSMDTSQKDGFLPELLKLSESCYTLEAQSICIIIGK